MAMHSKRFVFLALVVLAFLAAAPAWADHDRRRSRRAPERQSAPEWGYASHRGPTGYFELEAGSTLIPDQDVDGAVDNGDLDLESGFVVGGAAGMRLSPFFRVEGALGYRRAEVDTFEIDGPFLTDVEGRVGVFSTLANAYFDVPIPNFPATPFLGVGLGFAVLDVDLYDRFDGVNIEDSSVQFAWNLTGGVAWAVTQNLDIVTRYRYFATENSSHSASGTATLPGAADLEFESHEAVLGLRFNF
jgi:opacity protein-like surface antigen